MNKHFHLQDRVIAEMRYTVNRPNPTVICIVLQSEQETLDFPERRSQHQSAQWLIAMAEVSTPLPWWTCSPVVTVFKIQSGLYVCAISPANKTEDQCATPRRRITTGAVTWRDLLVWGGRKKELQTERRKARTLRQFIVERGWRGWGV